MATNLISAAFHTSYLESSPKLSFADVMDVLELDGDGLCNSNLALTVDSSVHLLHDQGMGIAVEMDVRGKDSNVIIVAKQGCQLFQWETFGLGHDDIKGEPYNHETYEDLQL